MFPNLVQKAGGILHSEATGVPQNGVNTFLLGLPPAFVNADWLELRIEALGPSVKSASFGSISPDKTQLAINFVQQGNDQVVITAQQKHTIVR